MRDAAFLPDRVHNVDYIDPFDDNVCVYLILQKARWRKHKIEVNNNNKKKFVNLFFSFYAPNFVYPSDLILLYSIEYFKNNICIIIRK